MDRPASPTTGPPSPSTVSRRHHRRSGAAGAVVELWGSHRPGSAAEGRQCPRSAAKGRRHPWSTAEGRRRPRSAARRCHGPRSASGGARQRGGGACRPVAVEVEILPVPWPLCTPRAGRGRVSPRHGRPAPLGREGVPTDGREGEPPAGQGGEGRRWWDGKGRGTGG